MFKGFIKLRITLLFVCFALICLSTSLMSQNQDSLIDSLKLEIQSLENDSLIMALQDNIGRNYMSSNLDSSMHYFNLCLKTALDSNYFGKVGTYELMRGFVHQHKGELDSSYAAQMRGIDYYTKGGDPS